MDVGTSYHLLRSYHLRWNILPAPARHNSYARIVVRFLTCLRSETTYSKCVMFSRVLDFANFANWPNLPLKMEDLHCLVYPIEQIRQTKYTLKIIRLGYLIKEDLDHIHMH